MSPPQGDPFVNCRLNPCSQSPCGINADCSATGARAVCRCRPNYEGDPFVQCNLNPCQQSPCGVNADCTANGQRAVCRCRTNYVGDPFSGCRLEPCSTSPCGTNADCTSSGQTAVCKCKTNYVGDPYTNCRFDPCQSSPCGQGVGFNSIVAILNQINCRRSVRTMVERQFASALLSTLATHTCLVVSIPASKMLVALTPIAPEVERELCVLVDLATWAPPTAGLAAVPTLASQGFAARAQSAKMLEVCLFR